MPGPTCKVFNEAFDRRMSTALSWAGVTRLGFVTQLDRLNIPVSAAYRPNSRSVSVHHGKGLTSEMALASAAGEAIETAHAERIELETITTDYRSLRSTGKAVYPGHLLQASGAFIDDSEKLDWLPARHLFSDTPAYIPFDTVSLDTTNETQSNGTGLIATSSGLGTGKTRDDAVLHGVCEAIERDAHTLWKMKSKASKDRCRLDLSSIGEADPTRLIDTCVKSGIAIAAWNITSDIGVPVVLIALVERESQSPTFVPYALGSACHPDPHKAFIKAFTEALQMRLLQITAVREDLLKGDYSPGNQPVWRSKLAEVNNLSFAQGWIGEPVCNGYSAFIEYIRSRFELLGIDGPYLVDLGRPELGVPVVKIVIPTLEDAIEGADQKLGQRAMSVLMAGE